MEEFITLKGIKVMQAERSRAARIAKEVGLVWLAQGYSDGSTSWTILFDFSTTDEQLVELREALWNDGLGSVEIVEREVEA